MPGQANGAGKGLEEFSGGGGGGRRDGGGGEMSEEGVDVAVQHQTALQRV